MSVYNVVREFEKEIAEYAGSDYAVAVDSCTNALLLCCLYQRVRWVHIPRKTYPGVACSIIHAGGKVCFTDEVWSGVYKLRPYEIYDGALRFRRRMYIRRSLYCLSFHSKKHLPIGRGGMILTDDAHVAAWCKRMRFDGRDEKPLKDDYIYKAGYNMYMTPEQAARGLTLFENIKKRDFMDMPVEDQGYIDLSKQEAFK